MSRSRDLRAIALEYGGDRAPVVTAKGDDVIAERILAEAERHGIHVTRDPRLLSMLSRVEIGEEIPRELYSAVAVILSWVYWLEGLTPEDRRR